MKKKKKSKEKHPWMHVSLSDTILLFIPPSSWYNKLILIWWRGRWKLRNCERNSGTLGEVEEEMIRRKKQKKASWYEEEDTMMKFASYENIVEMIYKHAIPRPKEDCSKTQQLGVSVVGVYLAGILCTLVSHPADNIVSYLNNSKGAKVADAVKKLGIWGLCSRAGEGDSALNIVLVGCLNALPDDEGHQVSDS